MNGIKMNMKKYIGKLLLCIAAALVIGLSAEPGMMLQADGAAAAPEGTISGLKQSGATTGGVDLQFNTLLGTGIQYAILVGNSDSTVTTEFTTVTGGFATLSGLSAGSTYYVRVVPFREASVEVPVGGKGAGEEDDVVTESTTVRLYGTASSVISVVTVPDAAPASVSQTASTSNSVTISWSASAGASGYMVDYFLSDSASPEKVHLVTTSTSAELTGLSSEKSYTAYITPYRYSTEGFTAYDSTVFASKSNLAIGAVNSGTPTGKPSGIKQKKAATDSAEISFSTLSDSSVQYSVQLSQSKKGKFTEYAIVKEGSCTINELSAGSSYYVKIVPFYQNWNSLNEEYDRVYGKASDVFEIVTVPGRSPKNITQTAAEKKGFTIQWDAVDGANGYYVDYYRSGSTSQKTTETGKNKIKLTKLSANREYNVYVTPYRKSASGFVAVDENNYTSKFNIPVLPSKAKKASVTKFWSSLGKVNLKTTKLECADGYEYALYTAYGKKAKKIATVSSTSYASADIRNAKLKTAAVFKVKVRAYITIGGKKVYGAWSDWSYISPSQEVTLQKSEESIHASWTKVKGADRYLVYISTDKDSGYKKCVVTSKTSCKITKYGNKKIKSGTRYYVYVVPQVKVSGVYKSAAKRDVVTEVE